ncbi:hypothetical protein HDU79_009015 [Rhizoclosmatium sp. JEL0117]|nr:hypothetical protein HDU79_009015 [Rhizoclosmatium sp. JEL0117]
MSVETELPGLLNTIPTELLTKILAWIPFPQICSLRRLCHLINSIILSTHFARQCLYLSLGPAVSGYNPRLRYSGAYSELEGHFLRAPKPFQEIIAGTYWPARTMIAWYLAKEFTGAPEALSALTSLVHLEMRGLVSGVIPESFGNLKSLKVLAFSHCGLTGGIPECIWELTGLEQLTLETNKLMGEIPAEVGNLQNLKVLQLTRNKLSGKLPVELGNLVKLKMLSLDDNRFSGPVPSTLGNLVQLDALIACRNQLSGMVPRELSQLPRLRVCNLSDNLELMCDFKFRILEL